MESKNKGDFLRLENGHFWIKRGHEVNFQQFEINQVFKDQILNKYKIARWGLNRRAKL